MIIYYLKRSIFIILHYINTSCSNIWHVLREKRRNIVLTFIFDFKINTKVINLEVKLLLINTLIILI